MKKLLFLLALIFTTTLVNAQEETSNKLVDETTISEAERIVDKYTGKVYEFAENTAKALEQPAKQVFKSVVRLQIAKGIGLLLLPIVALIFWILTFKLHNKTLTRLRNIRADKDVGPYSRNNTDYMDIADGVFTAFSFGLSIVFTIGAIFSTYNGLQYIIAPEWWGIKEILSLF